MSNFYGAYTLFKRENKRFLKVAMQTIFAPVLSNVMFLLVFGLSLNSAVNINGELSYLQFILPGLVMIGISNNAFQNPSSSLIIMKYQELIGDMMMIPLTRFEILVSIISSAVFRGLLVGSATLGVALFFADFTFPHIAILLLTSVLIAILFGTLGLFVGIWADDFDKMVFLLDFVITPLSFVGGVFYSLNTLPPLLQKISAFNPIVYTVDLMRYGLTGYHELPISKSLIILSLTTLLLLLLTYTLLRRGWKLQN